MATQAVSNYERDSIDGGPEVEGGSRGNAAGKNSSNGKLRKNSLRNSRRNGILSSRHRNSHVTRSSTNRNIEARRRKEKIRRRKRKSNRVTLIQRLIDQLERQPEVESRSLLRVTCHDVSYFVILFSAVLFLRSAIAQYTVGMMYQLRLGYLFSLSHLDLIKGTELIGFVVTVIFVALFGRRSHRPVLVASGVLVLALGAIIWPVPYFVSSTQSGLNVSYGCDTSRIAQPGSVLSSGGVPAKIYGQLCKASRTRNVTSNFEFCTSCPKDGDWTGKRDGFLYIVGLAGFLMGVGTGLFLTSGTLYIEEASRPTDVPLKYGFLFFMSGLGEFLGSCFAWWFSNYPENLNAGAAHPWSVRAWWLGMVIFSCLLFVCFPFFLFFPKWIIEPTWSIAQRQNRLARLTKLLAAAKRDRQKRREQIKRNKKIKQKQKGRKSGITNPKGSSNNPNQAYPSASNEPEPVPLDSSDSDAEGVGVENDVSSAPPNKTNHKTNKGVSFGDVIADHEEHLETSSSSPPSTGNGTSVAVEIMSTTRKSRTSQTPQDRVSRVLSQCFSAVWKLISKPTYLVAIVAVTLAAYLPAGYRRVITRFVHSQYFYDDFSSFFYSDGLSYSLADAIGSFAGGFIVWKLQLSTPKQLRLVISALAVNIFFFFLIFAVGCWRPEATSYQSKTALGSDLCSGDCDCSGVQLEEVCSPDGRRFPSPCSAGCSSLTLRDSSLVYTSCKCILSLGSSVSSPPPVNPEASAVFCSTCSAFGAYWVLLFLSIVAHSMAYVSIVLYFLRIVKEEERLLSLSFAVWIMALGAYVPGTAVFRGIESSSCEMWKSDCFDESVCWFHDLNKLRHVIHGSNIVFQSVALLGFTFILYLLDELNPCQGLDSSLEELDLGEGQEHLRRNSIIPVASSDNVLLDDVTEPDFQSNRDISSRFRDHDGVSYSSPVFKLEDFDLELNSYAGPNSISNPDEDYPPTMDELEMSRSRNFTADVDRMSGESSL